MSERVVLDLRTCGIPEVAVLGRYDYREAHRAIDRHVHRGALEICYLARGRQLYRVGRRDFLLSGGEVFVTFPGEVHSTGAAPQEKGRLYWVQLLLPARAGSLLSADAAGARALTARLRRLPHRHFAGSPMLGRLLDQVIDVARGPRGDLSRLVIQNRLVDFLLRVIELARHAPRTAVSPLISELLRHIDANLHQKLPLTQLAARTRLSLPRFKARFAFEVGVPPAEYVSRRRIERARDRLTRSTAPITRIAMDLGFASSQYFATVFRRYTGKAPSALRRE